MEIFACRLLDNVAGNPCQQPVLDGTGMNNCPKKNKEKDQGEQRPADYFTGFFQIRRLDWLKYKKRAGSSSGN